MTQPLVEASGVCRTVAHKQLLTNVSLTLQKGQRLAVVGTSGSGKTLLLRALALLDPIDAGEIRWRGRVVPAVEVPSARSRAIYLHQQPALAEGTVEENLRKPFGLRAHRGKTFERPRALNALASLGRPESFLSKQQRNLSGGEAQLTALLRVILLDPDVLLLDEPTAALDAKATASVERLIRDWIEEKADQRALVWVTHDPEQARRVCSSILHVRDGRVTGKD